ncbi:AmmeMemoRadiSam system protein B [Magnetospirillum molischianum]|uniref:MEMO1 family protein PHAMO_230034 n=1 Tax=Magnetospirillum molischianum DSM 120 TaxID=1150626 RepID=H8FRQ4_MAGML|nr:AmmeMemoRadiSam system protein B [Magnetospirillum molischianum]CCG41042.1 Predicted dioxygenase [Magnetospirillum molischianum DSM 120]
MTAIRLPAFAGQFYPSDPIAIRHQIATMLATAPHARATTPKAIIVPHAGWVYSGPIAAAAYAQLVPARGRVRRVVLLGPSHRIALRGLALCDAEAWASPLGQVLLDRDSALRLTTLPDHSISDPAHAQEHALEVQLPFLQAVLGDDFRLLPILVGEASAEIVAATLDTVWGDSETLIVVSTDLSHYLDYESCRRQDSGTAAAIERFDGTELALDSACGRNPLAGLLLAAQRRGMKIDRLDLRNSGDTAGSRDRVVGYGAWALYETGGDVEAIRAIGPTLLDLAWSSIRHGLIHGTPASAPSERSGHLDAAGAAFVTLTRRGLLRGCIGSPNAWRSLAEDITDNAFKAAFRDPRFPPLTEAELEELTVSISVLTPPVAMHFTNEADLLAQLRPRRDGLIIEDGGRRALFLPSVWEQLPERHAFLAHLKAKAGLDTKHWSASFHASRFEAVEIGKTADV